MVDPGCSGGGFDDVQDFHEQRVVMGALSDERRENNTAKRCGAQSGKRRGRPCKSRTRSCKNAAGKPATKEIDAGYKSDAGQ